MVVRDYLTQNFKFDDTRLKTLGLGKAEDESEKGKVEILIYPAGSKAQSQTQSVAKRAASAPR
jgi:hypothetical protein